MALGRKMQVTEPGQALRVASKNACSFLGVRESIGQRADDRAVAAVQQAVAVEDVIDAVIEIARMAIGIDDVDRIKAIGGIFDVGAMAESQRYIDHDVAGLPGRAKIIRECVGWLKTGI